MHFFLFIFESETRSYIPQTGMGCSNIATHLLNYNWHTKLKPHNYGKPWQFYSWAHHHSCWEKRSQWNATGGWCHVQNSIARAWLQNTRLIGKLEGAKGLGYGMYPAQFQMLLQYLKFIGTLLSVQESIRLLLTFLDRNVWLFGDCKKQVSEHDMFWRTSPHITINYTAQYLLKAIQTTYI